MNFLGSMRRGNRNNNNGGGDEGSKKKTGSVSLPSAPSSPSASTARHPQSNAGYASSSSSLVSGNSERSSSHSGNPMYGVGDGNDREISRATPSARLGRSERSHTVSSVRERTAQAEPSARQSSSERSAYPPQQDLYTRNVLESFTFGAASSGTPVAPSIDPLSAQDDADSEEFAFRSDTTPRPSLAGPSSQRPPGTVPNGFPGHSQSPQRRRRHSNSSTNTFGTSSASASATSLSSNLVDSRRGGGFITTPQTSSNEYTSDDEESEHRHPINSFSRNSPTSTQYTYSDEEFDDDYDDDRSEVEIDVSSEIHEDFGHFTSWNGTQQSFASSAYSRRPSLAVPIPTSSSPDVRDREDSIVTLRRPSRSLEGLRSNSLEQANYQASQENRPSQVSPTSMPESEVDWRDLRRRSIQHERERARAGQAVPDPTGVETAPVSGATVTGSPPPPHAQPSVFEGFDKTWASNAAGIVDVDWDLSEMADIVGGIRGPSSSNRGLRRDSTSTVSSARRYSTASTSSDPFTRHLKQSGGQHYADERAKWAFVLDPNGGQDSRGGRERSSISSIWASGGRPSFSSSSMIGSSANFQESIAPFAASERRWGRDKQKEAAPWKGMAPEAEEWWSSGTNGRYKVARKNQTTVEGKPPQQRLHITHHRNNPYSPKYDKSDGPSITIHKHSKAVAFSISRHYRPKASPDAQGRSSSSTHSSHMPISSIDRRRPSPMILLACRKVQEAYTSTNTTRKLEHHGLLNENGRHSSRDRERLARMQKEEDDWKKERERQRQKEQKKLEKAKGKGKGKDKGQQSSMSDLTAVASSSDSSNGSVTTDPQSISSAASSSQLPQPRTNRPSVDHSVRSHDTASSDRTITYQRRGSEALLSDEDDDFRPRAPARTPHTETYATLPPEVLESLAHNDSHGTGLFGGWGKKSSSLFQRQLQTAYKPPWAMSQPRYHDRKGIVEDLNTSFQDVGLLPAVDEVRASQKRKQRHQEARNTAKSLNPPEPDNVFTSFPAELLFMLLPLWPGETDASADAKTPFTVPDIPLHERLYLLVCYRPSDTPLPHQDEKGKKGNKKPSRSSPTSSRDSARADKSILFKKFHFSARIVTYGEIQGTNVRNPDAGLSVIGSLQEAYETMPQHKHVDTEFTMIGLSHSRDRGVELIPEGLEKLGLAYRELDPNAPPKEEDSNSIYPKSSVEQEEPDTIHILTPIGRAVVEMSWLGAMALTSFG